MSLQEEVERLRAQLTAAEQRTAAAEQQAAKERQRAAAAEQRAVKEQQQAEEERQRTQKTTLEECLKACHYRLQSALIVETDKQLTTKGFTSPKNKFYPKYLRLYDEFPEMLQQLYDEAHGFFHPHDQPGRRCLYPTLFLQTLGEDLSRRRLASEQDLQLYESVAVENVVRNIIDNLSQVSEARTQFRLGESITFENHPNTLSDLVNFNIQGQKVRSGII